MWGYIHPLYRLYRNVTSVHGNYIGIKIYKIITMGLHLILLVTPNYLMQPFENF